MSEYMSIEEGIEIFKARENFFHLKEDTLARKSLEAHQNIEKEIRQINWNGDDSFWDGVNAVSEIIDKYLKDIRKNNDKRRDS